MNDQPKKPKISIISVNWWGKEFVDLLIESVLSKTKNIQDVEVLIIDNSKSINIGKVQNLRILQPDNNLGHGKGLDYAVQQARGEYILALDIDAHILLKDWDEKIVNYYQNRNQKDPDGRLKMITGEGGQLKPSRPCVCFFERQFFLDNKLSFVAKDLEGVKFDVGVHAYFKTLSLGYAVEFFNYAKTKFNDVFGNDYLFNGEVFVYHNWYGTRWYNVSGDRVHDKIDSIKWEDFEIKKDNLFNQINK